MIYKVNGHMVKREWNFHPSHPRPKHHSITAARNTYSGVLCYMGGDSIEVVERFVKNQWPQAVIESIVPLDDSDVLKLLVSQQILR